MLYKLTLTSGFRSVSGSRLPRLWHPGPYRVPEDMSETVAEQAIRAGCAYKHKQPPAVQKVVPELAPTVAGDPDPEPGDDESPTPKRGRRKKGPAPENKVLGAAAENKGDAR